MQTITITTADNVSEETYAFICEKLRERLGEVTFLRKTDSSLIGGFIADVGGEIYDMSISSRLTQMKTFVK